MVKKAVLVGCNYPGSDAELKGCINDVMGMKELLTNIYGFNEGDIEILIDTDGSYTQPTGKNIKNSLKKLISDASDGDILFFHYSGHGTQVPTQDKDEADRKDEAIVPTDMNLITDDDLRAMIAPLPDGAKLTLICDCCHSGTLLDHATVQITGDKDGGSGGGDLAGDIMSALGVKDLPEGGFDVKSGKHGKDRSLDPSMLASMLGSSTGQSGISPTNIYSTLQQAFGSDSSLKVNTYANMAAAAYSQMTGNKPPVSSSIITKILGICFGGSSSGDQADSGGNSGEPQFDGATHAPESGGQGLGADKGILISGCQDNETSADACPSGDPAKAYGALSNALQTALKKFNQSNPDKNISYMQLVSAVREALSKSGFQQSPCLECSEKNANSPFIVTE